MRSPRSAARRRSAVVSGLVLLAASAVWLTLPVAGVVGTGVALVSCLVAIASLTITIRHNARTRLERPPAEALGAVTDVLALSVRKQWEDEETVRQVHDPFPLPVRWHNADERYADHWGNVHRSPRLNEAIRLDGEGDEISAVFDRVPSGRLVVLGEAGAGKTILTSRFVLTQLARRKPGDDAPVPMIFSLGSWDPAVPLRSWLVRQLLTHQPALAANHSSGTTIAEALLAEHRVLPVLDGFDEVPAQLRAKAIKAVNLALGEHTKLLLTSRPAEYTQAVEAGDVLTGAAVVEISDLEVEDVAEYLPRTTRKSGPGAQTKWHPVMDRLRAPGDDPAAEAVAATLRTPLMVALARAGYSDTDVDPDELLTSAGDPAAKLFAGFVPAVYSSEARRAPDLEKIRRWLRFLATHDTENDSHDFAWWHLVSTVPRALQAATAGLLAFLPLVTVIGLAGLFGSWVPGAQALWFWCGLSFAVLTALATAVVVGLGYGLDLTPAPSRMRLRFRQRDEQRFASVLGGLLRWRALVWLGTWVLGGAAFSVMGIAAGLDGSPLVSLAGTMTIGLVSWFAIGFVRLLATPLDPRTTISPAELLRVGRRTALSQGLIVGCAIGATGGLVAVTAVGTIYHLMSGGPGLLAVIILGGVAGTTATWLFIFTVWGPWLLARVWHAARGELPWRLMAFLADAHERGVLRQAGGVYQFRHARLREHLENPHDSGKSGGPEPVVAGVGSAP